ncbi:MAG: glycoside hydrolase family 5 protein [Ruminococcus sp.]|nr:glycoside hydrolase family 5 protein [Ruminococcus sp.]
MGDSDGANGSAIDDGRMLLELSAEEIAEDMGFVINLGNTMEAYWEDLNHLTSGCMTIGDDTAKDYETCWGAVETTQEIIDGMKAAGFRTIRIPVYWGNMMENDGTCQIADAYFDRVEEIIDYCRKDDLYVVINMHHYDALLIQNHEKEEVLEAAKTLWIQIAERFEAYSDYLIFEGYNESLGGSQESDQLSDAELYDYVNEMNQTFVDAVRSTGGNNANRMLIVSGYWTNIDKTTDARFSMPEDTAEDRLMVSVHYVDNAKCWSNQIGNQTWLDYSREQCELLKAAFTDQGYPVFLGECTSIYESERIAADAIYTTSTECLEQMYQMILSYDFVPVLWDISNNFYSRDDCVISSESDRTLLLTLSSTLGA